MLDCGDDISRRAAAAAPLYIVGVGHGTVVDLAWKYCKVLCHSTPFLDSVVTPTAEPFFLLPQPLLLYAATDH
jgi:hypothetical protein